MKKTKKENNHFPIPLWRGLIIKRARLKIEDKIYIPENSETPTNEGIIMAISDELIGKIEVGDRVIFNSRANLMIVHEEKEYLGIHESSVYAKIVTDKHGVDSLVPFNKTILLTKGNETIVLKSGLALPEQQNMIHWGTVIGAGEKVRKEIAIGKKVIWSHGVDFNFMFRNRPIMCMSEVDILIILPDNAFVSNGIHWNTRRNDISLDKLPENEKKEKVKGTKFYDMKDIKKATKK